MSRILPTQLTLQSIRNAINALWDHAETTKSGVEEIRVKMLGTGTTVAAGSAGGAAKGGVTDQSLADLIAEVRAVASDGVLSKAEKVRVAIDYQALLADQASLDSTGAAAGLTTQVATMDEAVAALTDYLASLQPVWSDTTQDTPIDPATWTAAWNAAYAATSTLNQAIAAAHAASVTAVNTLANQAKDTAVAAEQQLALIGDDGTISDQERPQLKTWLTGIEATYNQALALATGRVSSATLSIQQTAWTPIYAYFSDIILAQSGNTTLAGDGSHTGVQRWDANVAAIQQIPVNILSALTQVLADGNNPGMIVGVQGGSINNGIINVNTQPYNATFSQTIGDGTTAVFDLAHNLNGTVLYAIWQKNGSAWDAADCTVKATDANTLRLTFGSAPAASSILVLVVSSTVITGTGGSGDGGALPDQNGHANQFLETNGIAPGWVAIKQVPDPTGFSNAVLATNGTTYYWTNALTSAAAIQQTLTAAGLQVPAIVSSLPALPNTAYPSGAIVSYQAKLYINQGGTWVNYITTVQAPDIKAALQTGGMTVPTVVANLPTLPDAAYPNGCLVVLAGNGNLYRNNNGSWTDGVAATQLTGQLTDAQIAAVAAAKLTGQITSTQITDNAISTAKLAAGSVLTAQLAAGAVTTDQLAASAVTAGKIAAASISSDKIQANAVQAGAIAAGAVSADKIAVNAITADKIQAGAISTDKLAANAITTDKLAANSITASQIAAGTIGAAQLSANCISSDKLATNLALINQTLSSFSFTPGQNNNGTPIGFGLYATPQASKDVNGTAFPNGAIAEFGGDINLGGYRLSDLGVAKIFYGTNGNWQQVGQTVSGSDRWDWYAPSMGKPGTKYRVKVTLQAAGCPGGTYYGGSAGGTLQVILNVQQGTHLYGYVGGPSGIEPAPNSTLYIDSVNNVSGFADGLLATIYGGYTGRTGGGVGIPATGWSINGQNPSGNSGSPAYVIPGLVFPIIISGAAAGQSGSNSGACGGFQCGSNSGTCSGGAASAFGRGGNAGSSYGSAPAATAYGAGGGGGPNGGGLGGAGVVMIEIL